MEERKYSLVIPYSRFEPKVVVSVEIELKPGDNKKTTRRTTKKQHNPPLNNRTAYEDGQLELF
jgi:hypothetical protein